MKQPHQDFKSKVEEIISRDNRYAFTAYEYVANSVTKIAQTAAANAGAAPNRHISGKQLIDGLKHILLNDFDRTTIDVLHAWGLFTTEDIGNVVFNLVGAKLLGVSDRDSIDDFKNQGDFYDMFVSPYLPSGEINDPMPVIN